jgi:hypothetical protein
MDEYLKKNLTLYLTDEGLLLTWSEIWDSMAANYAHNWPILRIRDGGNAKN